MNERTLGKRSVGALERIAIEDLNRHYTVKEVFKSPILAVRGFVEKNYSKGMHSQEFYEVNIVLSGSAVHKIGEREITVGAGDTFIIPPSVLHGYSGGEGFDVYHLLISPQYLEKNSAELKLLPAFSALFRIDPLMREKTSARLHFVLDENELASLTPTLNGLTEHSSQSGAENAIIAGGEALIVIARLCAIYESRGVSAPDEAEDEAFLASIAYVYEHFDKKLTVDTLSRIARMSRTSYIARFKRVTGMPPARFQRQYRVTVAKQMLADGRMTEAEIAQAVGCYDTSHLIRILKSCSGTLVLRRDSITPQQ